MKKQLLLLIAIFTISAVSSFKLKAQQKVYWAKNVLEFSTETTFANQSLEFRATQALGKPNKLPTYGSSACAWQPSMADNSADDFIKVNFDTLMAIRQVSIAENLGQGCIYKIVAFDQQNKEYVLLNKEEPNVNETGKMFCLILPALTTYKVAAIKIYLKTAKVKGFNQIDAIGISQNEKPIKVYIKTADEAPKDVKRETFGDKVNSKGSELAPVLSQDGETLYFTKEIEKKGKKTKKDQDIYASIKDADGNWTKSKSIGGALNDDDSNAALSISADGREIFLLNQYKKDGTKGAGISHAYKTKNGWTTPENIKIENYYNKSAYADFTVSPDGKTLVMSIQRQKFVGKRDLYVSFNKSQNLWSEPVHMGNIINTAENDITPFIGADNKTLYFSTQGYPTFGDNDVFMAYRLDESWTNWSEPENMGYAINTPYWDGFFKIPASSKYAVMTSTSADGTEDSYRVILPEKKKPQPEGVALISGRVLRT
ncbi:MAG: PD40 domain-containing protein, partial [Pseudarcicella sp.]|nr:PD40 domain-containing protein [Pseudarcicella sp.]